jgi:chloramphenicol-sensitive protein RarD
LLGCSISQNTSANEVFMNKGNLYAAGTYFIWGFFPLYFKALQAVPAAQIMSHRVVWSFIFILGLILLKRDLRNLIGSCASSRTILIYTFAACLLAINWLTYIWGVNAGFVVETSLGYFITPLVSVLLGTIFLREKLRLSQWIPIGFAGLGVLYLTLSYGAVPWIALVLAFTFGTYGLLKKTAPLGALQGLALETTILFLPCLLFLLYSEAQGIGAFGHLGLATSSLLAVAGIVTAVPLLLFSSAARRINLSTLGILQYIAPTCQFLLGVLVYGEPFTPARLVGFGLIWSALVLYSLEGIIVRRRAELSAAA